MLRAVLLSLQPTAQRMLRWSQAQRLMKQGQALREMTWVGFKAESMWLYDQFFSSTAVYERGAF